MLERELECDGVRADAGGGLSRLLQRARGGAGGLDSPKPRRVALSPGVQKAPMHALRSVWFVFLLAWLALAPSTARAQVEVRVDPRVELVCVLARFAGLPEFNAANSDSPYARRVEQHFAGQREHAAVARLRELRAQNGVSYDALPSLAVHLVDARGLELRAPLEPWPERLDARWKPGDLPSFLVLARDFATRSKAAEFFDAEREFYAQVEQRFSISVPRERGLAWLDSFYGAKPRMRCTALIGLLCGGRNFGVGVKLAGAPEELTPVLGCWEFDAQGQPQFGADYGPLFLHEVAHSYANPLVERHFERLRAAGDRIHASCAESMRKQGYANARIVLCETLVRASVVRCRIALEGDAAGAQQAQAERAEHFEWVPKLAEQLAEYESARERWSDLDAYVPRIAEHLDAYAAQLGELEAKRPKLVGSTPSNGAVDVDASLSELVFTFDRPMRDQSWSIVGRPDDQPKITGKLRYDSSRKQLTVPVQLEPGKTYRFALNSGRFQGFVSADGVPLAPLEMSFTVKAN